MARAISNAYDTEPGRIVVISSLRRKCDAEHFYATFQGCYFISLIADEQTLVERIVSRNRVMDFPPGTPESDKPDIARKLLADEEKVHGIMQMLGYVATIVPRERTYIIDTSRQKDTKELEHEVDRALAHFKLF